MQRQASFITQRSRISATNKRYQLAIKLHNFRNGVGKQKSSLRKTDKPLRAGVLSAAAINWTAFYDPVDTHPDIVVAGVAARSLDKAQAQIDKYKLTGAKAYGSYDELLSDPEIDTVYTALPNGLHAQWVIKALEKGKHVLVEKPIASTAADVELIRAAANKSGKVVLEAVHWRFHPVAHLVKEKIESGEYGKLESFQANMVLPGGGLGADDIRYRYDLAGGASMDLNYVLSAARYICNSRGDLTVDVQEAKPRINANDNKIDEAMDTVIVFTRAEDGSKVTSKTHGDLNPAKLLGVIPKFWDAMPSFTVELSKARIHLDNFVGPHMSHTVTISHKDDTGKLTGKKETLSAFKGGSLWGDRGEKWWTTYRYQLESFVDMVRATEAGKKDGEGVACWVDLDESKGVLELIDGVYDKAGLPRRESSGL